MPTTVAGSQPDASRSETNLALRSALSRIRAVPTVLLLVMIVGAAVAAHAQLPSKPKPVDATAAHEKALVEAETPATPAPTASPLTPAQAIPLAQVADSAEDLDRLLDDISRQMKDGPNLVDQNRAAQAREQEVRDRAQQVDILLSGTPSSLQIRDEDAYWRPLSQQVTAQRRALTTRAAGLQSAITQLDEQQAKWQATWDGIQDPTGIEAVAARVRQELDAIGKTRALAGDQLKLVLTLQNQTSQTSRTVAEVMIKLNDAEERFRARLFEQDSHPLWSSSQLRSLDPDITRTLRRSADRDFSTVKEYLRAHYGGLFLTVVFYLISLLVAFRLRSRVNSGAATGAVVYAKKGLQRPYALALLLSVMALSEPLATAPASVASLFYILWIVATLRLLPPLIEPGLRRFLFVLAATGLFEGFRVWMPFSPMLKRTLLTWGVLIALLALGWIARSDKLADLHLPKRRALALTVAMRLGLCLLVISLIANLFGFVALAYVTGAGTLLSAFFLVAMYCMVRMLHIVLSVSLQGDWAATLRAGRLEAIETWSFRIIAVIAALLWLRFELYLFTVHDSVMGAISGLLNYPLPLPKVQFTFGNALGVILILGIGFVFAKASTLLVRSILVSRMPSQPGLPYAVSKIAYYCLMVGVLLLAIMQAGVELNKFTVITGALGVGLGFGLQNIVSNFASGVILLFEMPIRVNDIVEVNGLLGTVSKIGARASTIQTAQGAEVIVPNNILLSNQVINWTLSSPRRRVEIPVGIAYGTDPEVVIQLLVAAADSVAGVMHDPKPRAFFLGFGDSALNFELRFWSATQEGWFELKSEVAIRVSSALRDAGIEVPFPQRDLHLRSFDAGAAEALSGQAPSTTLAPVEVGPPPPAHSATLPRR